MPPASRRLRTDATGPVITPASTGFSLVEALVAVVVLAVALAASSVAMRGITNLLGRSGEINARSLAIDNDISEIKRLASLYTACKVSTGSMPPAQSDPSKEDGDDYCATGISSSQPAYFFPVDPGTNEANITAFFNACKATSAASHITQGFITAISDLPSDLGAGVSRSSVAREAPTDPKNHNVIVRYTATDGSMQRVIKVVPVLSAWCN